MSTSNNKAVEVAELEKKFGSFAAVDKVSFSVNEGEIFGFLGPNGAGKSTTIRMLCGIIAPSSGKGQIAGYDIVKEQWHIKQHIGYMSQKFSLYNDLTVGENIDFYSGIYGVPDNKKKIQKDRTVRMAGLEDCVNKRTGILPGGVKQRLALGCAIIHEPKILFLDEPTSGVDPLSRARFWDIIRTMAVVGVTIFVTTHYMDEAENCNRIAFIYKGKLIALGTPKELKTEYMQEDVLEIILPNAQTYLEKIKQLPGIRETALFGINMHAIVENGEKAIENIKTLLVKEGVSDYKVAKILPSLEDVFVTLIERTDSGLPPK